MIINIILYVILPIPVFIVSIFLVINNRRNERE